MMTPEWLNVDCNQHAAHIPLPCHDPHIQNNPIIEAAYPHVTIEGQVILWQLQTKGCINLSDILGIPTEPIPVAQWCNNMHSLESTSTCQPTSHALWMLNNKQVHTWMAPTNRQVWHPKQFPEKAVSIMLTRDWNDWSLSKLLSPRMTADLNQATWFCVQIACQAECPHSTTMQWSMDSM